MVSKVVITEYAQGQLDDHIFYLLVEKGNSQAAESLLEDAVLIKEKLLQAGDSLKYCDNDELRNLGYRKIGFQRHDYLWLYQVIEDTAYVQATYHTLQDYENTFIRDNLRL